MRMYMNVWDKEFRIRAIRPGDLQDVGRISQEAFAEPWQLDKLARYVRNRGDRRGVIAMYRDEVIGFALFERHQSELYVAYVAVDRVFQWNGVGAALTRRVVEMAPRLVGSSHARLHCCANEAAPQRTYTKVGFKIVGTVPGMYGRFGDGLEMAFSGNSGVPT